MSDAVIRAQRCLGTKHIYFITVFKSFFGGSVILLRFTSLSFLLLHVAKLNMTGNHDESRLLIYFTLNQLAPLNRVEM